MLTIVMGSERHMGKISHSNAHRIYENNQKGVSSIKKTSSAKVIKERTATTPCKYTSENALFFFVIPILLNNQWVLLIVFSFMFALKV